ncbi:hypothetical protein D3877_01095 [Azospirillum cavernae]|uniref:Uncharacterized protein n=1 Tax=Azospirillum cavernae TaxID=2320860 RepID=A0A418VZZ8_9PROT|nr:hypothetical protein [Azospirillum cavernae]RJF83323.1 hypothetical protein D3877_01095 [Azospirillum cavernae]
MTQSLPDALADVRRAYRLLWSYQKRVLNIVAMIREQLGFVPHHIEYQFSRPGQRMESPETWMWDALPFSLIGFDATNQGDPKAIGARLLYIEVVSDTGLMIEKDRGGGDWEPNPLVFSPLEESRSELLLYLVENRRNRRGDVSWRNNIMPEVEWPLADGGHDYKTAGVRTYGERIDLVELGDPVALSNRVELFRINADRELAGDGAV